MRIAIFTNNYLPNPYGVAGSVESFRKEFEKMGHEVFIFAPRWKGYNDENINVFRYPSIETNVKIRFYLGIPFSLKINKILENLDLDVIHSQHPNLMGGAAMHWARKKNIPLIFTWHTLFDQYAHFAPFIPKKIAVWWLIRNARNFANRCDAVVAPTPSVIEILRKWGVTNRNIFAIPTGVEENLFFYPDREKIRKAHGVKVDEILLSVVTRLTAEKNMEFLVETAVEILKKNEKVKLMVCGEGDIRKKLEEIVLKAGLRGKAIFVGIIPNQYKKDYYAAGDIFIYASKSETQGMTLSEAMYAGLPIVAVRSTGVKDLVEDRKTGFLVAENTNEFSEAVQKLIDGENLRKNFGEEAKRMAKEKYTAKACAQKMLELYKKSIKLKHA